MREDESKHYGVLGMKLGRRKNPNYRYTSSATKRYSRKAEKAKQRGDSESASEFKKRAKRSQEFDDKMFANVKKTGAPTTVYSAISLGTGVTKTYQALRVSTENSAHSRTISAGGAAAAFALAGPIGDLAVRTIVREDYVNR